MTDRIVSGMVVAVRYAIGGNDMTDFIRRRPTSSFYVLAFVLGAAFISIRSFDPSAMADMFKTMRAKPWHPDIITSFPFVLERPSLVSGYLFPFAPSLAAIVIAWIAWRREGLRRLFDRFRPWREGVTWREGLLVYAMAFAVYLAIVGFIVILLFVNGPESGLGPMLQRYGATPVGIWSFMIIAPFLGPGGLLEELGWRGFALPLLVEKLKNPLVATVVLGLLWGIWHLPRDVPGLLSGDPAQIRGGSYPGYVYDQIGFIWGTIASSIVISYVFFKTGGSWWAAMLVHNFGNEFSVAMTMMTKAVTQVGGFTIRPGGVATSILAIAIVLFAGSELGRRKERLEAT